MELEVSCGFLLYREIEGVRKYLLLKNHEYAYWEFPKGHQEEGETYVEAAYREVMEETNIGKDDIAAVRDNEELVSEFTRYTNHKGSLRHIELFLGETSKEPMLSDEHCGYVWATEKEALELFKFDDQREFFKKLISHLS